MDRDALFTLMALKLGAPKELSSMRHSGGKAPTQAEQFDIDYALKFVSLACVNGHTFDNQRELESMHKAYVTWYKRNSLRG